MTVDDLSSQLGDFGRYQCYLVLGASIPQFLAGVAVLQNLFLLGVPQHRCYVPGFDDDVSSFNEPWTNLTIPESSSCQRYAMVNQNHTASNTSWPSDNLTTVSCQKYIYSTEIFIETAVSEWNLVCDLQWLPSLSTSVFMLGNIAGSLIYGILSDKYGRRHVLALGALAQCLSAILVSMSPNIYLYTAANFLVSANEIGQFITGYVLGIEYVGTKYRTWCASGYQIVFALGQVLLAVMAYNVRHWRHLEVCLAILFASGSLLRFLVPESPMWLVSKGRNDEAHDFVLKGAKWNRIQLKPRSVPFQTLSPVSDSKSGTFADIFQHRKLRRWTLNLFVSWAACGFIYYGLSFSAESIGEGSSIYFNTALMCITAVPFIILATAAADRWGRKGSLITTFLASATCCILATMLDGWLRLSFAIMGRGCIAASYALVYIHSAEIYPTTVRSLAIGLCSLFSRLGGVIAPLTLTLKFAGESTSLIICACAALAAGILVFDLPETRGRQLPDTMDDVDNIGEK
ncbi:Organic cation transporter protein [Halotydeus destructor]|nr:Organic cation transporter protein [Halotydeus destructor]